MDKSERIFERLKENRLIALIAPKDVDQSLRAYEVLTPLGVVMEVAFRTPAAAEGIRAILKSHSDALVLAGTVMTEAQALQAMEAGAAGVVSADYMPKVVRICARRDVMCIPGGHGDVGKQLVQKAELYGCAFEELRLKHPYQWIHKLFPAVTHDAMYAGLAQAWKGPFTGLQVVYTGGLTLDNVGDLARRDPDGIFCASALTVPIDDCDQMAAIARDWLGTINKHRAT
jgi:2-dehydro-3-deoxyphosphogluconate aldolase/(4S)-4-hydroxy-2-oxoglutarate aldolase